MKKSILLIVLALFFSLNISGCSLFSSDEEEAESATMAEAGDAGEDGDEFASDEFETGDDGGDIESEDFDPEAMAKDDTAVEGGDDFGDLAGNDVEVEDNFGDEEYPDDEFGSPGAAATTAAAAGDDFSEDYIDDDNFSDEVDDSFGGEDGLDSAAMVADAEAGDDALFVDEGGGLPEDTMSGNQEEDLFAQDTPSPVVDTPDFADSTYDTGYDAGFGGDVNAGLVSVKKMKPAAYKRAGANVNRLYVVRSGDNMDSVAQKLYGSSSEVEKLYSFNSHHRGRTLDVGDKIYYESPNNSNDPSMMTYYEDNNMTPSYYTSQDGDNIRKVAKNLLGHERSWMEIYATNENIESKGRIPAGLQIRYWPEGGTPAPVMAMNDPEPMADPVMDDPAPIPDPEPIAMDDPEPIDDPTMDDPEPIAMDDPADMANLDDPESLDDPTMDDGMDTGPAAGQVANNPPPPPSNKPLVAPPPPPGAKPMMNKPGPPKPIAGNPASNDPLAAISGDDNMIMGALGGLLLLAALIMIIFIRRSRAKRVNFSQTQV